MRLVCPSCKAQYEVGDGVIPPDGRDVQCSNCGQTWFEKPRVAEPTPQAAAPPAQPQHDPDFDEPPRARSVQPPAPGPAVSTGAADILREEAERERLSRAKEKGESVEVQPDLGLDQSPERLNAARERVARMRTAAQRDLGEDEADVRDVVAQMVASSRDLLPDIEEINSTLTATTVRKEKERGIGEVDSEAAAARRRRGFRMGFGLMLAIWAVLLGAYLLEPAISIRVPSAAPTLSAYSDWADGVRSGLDLWVQGSVESLTRMMSDAVAGS
ncbi:MAG: zinc-ribbon domain-containing protein [Pseudomonadota bacterium]